LSGQDAAITDKAVQDAETVGEISVLLVFIAVTDPAQCFVGTAVREDDFRLDPVFEFEPLGCNEAKAALADIFNDAFVLLGLFGLPAIDLQYFAAAGFAGLSDVFTRLRVHSWFRLSF
jgi:hypothetical protein